MSPFSIFITDVPLISKYLLVAGIPIDGQPTVLVAFHIHSTITVGWPSMGIPATNKYLLVAGIPIDGQPTVLVAFHIHSTIAIFLLAMIETTSKSVSVTPDIVLFAYSSIAFL